MRIRTRMAVVALVVAIPQLLALGWWDGRTRQTIAAHAFTGLLRRVTDEVEAPWSCAADPASWAEGASGPPGPPPGPPPGLPPLPPLGRHGQGPGPGMPRPPELRAWSADDPAFPGDPDVLPLGVQVPLPQGFWSQRVLVAERTGWGGGCEIVTVEGSALPVGVGLLPRLSPLWAGPAILVATVMWLAAGPPVARIRRLTEAVRDGRRPIPIAGDDEVGELAAAFEAATEARIRREEALREFVASTAHDVRIPLTVLRGHLAALEQAFDPETLGRAVAETQYVGALLDDLAAHARMEAPGPVAAFGLSEVVERVISRHAPIARRSGVALAHGVPEEPVVATGELTLVEQALSNLVYNAIRHNRPGGHVAVTLDRIDGGFRLEVLDDGPGVPAEERVRLTERGYRGAEARGRDLPGEGLGLHIVARVAERHGWRFGLEDGPEGGLLAWIEGG